MDNPQFPRTTVVNPSDLDQAIYEALDELHISFGKDGAVGFDALVDDPKMRGSIRRVAMNVAWPAPFNHAPIVTLEEKYLVLAELRKIFIRSAGREAMNVIAKPGPMITKPGPLIIGIEADNEKTDFIGKEGNRNAEGREGKGDGTDGAQAGRAEKS